MMLSDSGSLVYLNGSSCSVEGQFVEYFGSFKVSGSLKKL